MTPPVIAETLDTLRRMGACREAVAWAATQPDPARAWAACPRGDWMLWFLGHTGAGRRTLVLVACDVAEEALRYVPAGEDRPARAIATTRAWARGEATLEEVHAAADAVATYAAHTDAYSAAAHAARAAYSAADAADAHTYVAAAREAAYYAAHAAAAADGEVVAALARSADLVRARFPSPPELR